MKNAKARNRHRSPQGLLRETPGDEAQLHQQRRMELHDAIASYARREAGGSADLDAQLEEGGLESLLVDQNRARARATASSTAKRRSS